MDENMLLFFSNINLGVLLKIQFAINAIKNFFFLSHTMCYYVLLYIVTIYYYIYFNIGVVYIIIILIYHYY